MEFKMSKKLLAVATVIGTVTVIAGGYFFIIDNVWKPSVKVISVDFGDKVNEKSAVIEHNGKTINITGEMPYLLVGKWGVRIGSSRLELIKNNMVYKYL